MKKVERKAPPGGRYVFSVTTLRLAAGKLSRFFPDDHRRGVLLTF